ncbi:MAG: Xaa-Pro dipeptidase [Myxococcota bacterium]
MITRPRLLDSYQAHVAHLRSAYDKALDAAGLDAVAIHSGSLLRKSIFDDQYWSLKLVPSFQHWAPLPWPDSAILVVRGKGARVLAHQDKSFWERHTTPDWDLIRSALEVTMLDGPEDVKRHLPSGGRVAFVGENLERAASWGVEPARINPAPLMEALEELRVHKTPYEKMCIAEANRIACQGHQRVAREFAAGERSELRLHLAFLDETRQDDPETPYKNIVAIGSAAAILHHVSYRKDKLDDGESLLVDAGATYQGYASDITRTYVQRKTTQADLFASLVERVNSMQQALCGVARLGRPYESLHDETHTRLASILKDLDLVRMPVDQMVSSGVTRLFLPHGLGHSLGLVCHDVGCAKIKPRPENKWLRNTRTIEKDQCFTIEPGVYFVDTLMDDLKAGPHGKDVNWKNVDALRSFGGVRIEDDVVVRGAEEPVENLTRSYLP